MMMIRAAVAGLVLGALAPAAIAQTPAPATTAPTTSTPAAPAAAAPIAPATPQPEAAPPPVSAQPALPPPVAAPPPAAPPVAAEQEVVENPYGLSALWNGGDFVARGTLVALLLMSLGTWYVIITKFVEQAMIGLEARQAARRFWTAASIADGAGLLGRRSAFRALVDDGMRAADQYEGTLAEQIDRNSWIAMSLQRSADAIANRLQRGLALLATVGSTAPFVGLFGTVWGIYHALTAIGIAGQASIDKVAGPVGEALIMTAMGLAVAVPAVLGYNWMVRRNKTILERVRSFAADLHALLIGRGRIVAEPAPAVRRAV
jgi:biopolymer transport protein ExbB